MVNSVSKELAAARAEPPPILSAFKRFAEHSSGRIVFVDCGAPTEGIYGMSMTLGISILSQIAREEGFDHTFTHLNRAPGGSVLRTPPEISAQFESILSKVLPGDVLALSSTSPGHTLAIELASMAAETFFDQVLIIKGGKTHETFAGARLQKDARYPVHFSFIGDADISFRNFLRLLRVAKNLNVDQIELSLANEPITYRGRRSPAVISKLLPSQHLLPALEHLEVAKPYSIFEGQLEPDEMMVRVMGQRGCPEPCTFCALDKSATRIDATRLVDYLRDLVISSHTKGRRIGGVFFESGTFIMDPKLDHRVIDESLATSERWLDRFTLEMIQLNTELSQRFGATLKFAIQTTAKSIKQDVVQQLKSAGLVGAYVGVENTDPSVLRQMSAVSKTGTGEGGRHLCFNAIQVLRSLGVNASCATMVEVGLERSAVQTVLDLMSAEPHEIFIEMRAVYPGTPDSFRVHDTASEKRVDPADIERFYSEGRFNGQGSPNPEDQAKIIVRTNEASRLEVPHATEVTQSARQFYSKLRSVAKERDYEVLCDGHYMKLRMPRANSATRQVEP